MDYEILKRQIYSAFSTGKYWRWTLEQHISFFVWFYQTYRETFGEDHTRLKTETVRKVMERLEDYDYEYSKELATAYFHTDLDCDYSIVHFVHGKIRELRDYEITA